jgi:hypothetical protein
MGKRLNLETDVTLGGSNASDKKAASQKAIKSYVDNKAITYTLNASVSVVDNTKDVAHIYPEAIFARGGLIMGGTAAAAGLVTRGICGASTPNATTGACSKDRLYLNYDGDTTWNPTVRGIVINAGSYGTDLGQSMYSYCAVRGDIVKAWVEAKGYITGISSGDVTTALGYTPESTANKVTSISSSSTDTQYPTAKCVYDIVGDIETLLAAI